MLRSCMAALDCSPRVVASANVFISCNVHAIRNPMTTIDLKAIEARLAAATPADKWRGGVFYNDGAYPVGPYSRDERQAKADAAFIMHARTDVPALIERLRALSDVLISGALRSYGVGKEIADSIRPPSLGARGDERAYTEGHRMALRGLLGYVLGALAGDGARDPHAEAIAEREDVRRVLRRVCALHGDNEWSDDLHLGDVIEKHLEPHLNTGVLVLKNDEAVTFDLDDEQPEAPCTCKPSLHLADPDCLKHGPF